MELWSPRSAGKRPSSQGRTITAQGRRAQTGAVQPQHWNEEGSGQTKTHKVDGRRCKDALLVIQRDAVASKHGIGGSPGRARNGGRGENGSSILVANVMFQ